MREDAFSTFTCLEAAMADLSFHYLDSTNQEFGPFPANTLRDWFAQGLFPVGGNLPVRLTTWLKHVPLKLCYPNLDQAFVGPPAISSPDEAPRYGAGAEAAPAPFPGQQMNQFMMMP